MAILTDDIRKRLDNLFTGLWAARDAVNRSWGARSFRYHPTYIHRGNVLLSGETRFSKLWVLTPGSLVEPVFGDPRAHCDTFPIITGGECVRISDYDDGPWWEFVAAELPKMEEELAAYYAAKAAKRTEDARVAKVARDAQLERARAAMLA